MQITSRDNSKVKQVRSLRQRKGREAAGLFLVEGIRHVGEAVEAAAHPLSRTEIAYIFYSPDLLTSPYAAQLVQEQTALQTPCFSLPADLFNTLAEKENPQGILAVVNLRQPDLASLEPENFPWAVALVAPQDPGNLGTIIRTVDAVGASGLLLLDSSADPYHPSAIRASMGAIFWHPVVPASFNQFTNWAKKHGYTIYGTSTRGSQEYRQIESYLRPRILLLGSEREGLTADQTAACHHLIRLPMHGKVTSLNLAVAAGVFLYDMLAKSGE